MAVTVSHRKRERENSHQHMQAERKSNGAMNPLYSWWTEAVLYKVISQMMTEDR
jgi:hypothetical protein